MKFLGIDYGTKRVGIAVSDDDGRVAFPKDVFQNSDKIFKKIEEFCRAEKITTIVIGDSKNYLGDDNPIMAEVALLVEALGRAGFEVHLEPEFLTTAQAVKIQGNVEGIDASAAAIILQSYLDKIQNSNIKNQNDNEKIKNTAARLEGGEKIGYSDFQKVEMTVGKILTAQKIPDTDKLLELTVDFGEPSTRKIVSGISSYFPDPSVLVGKNCLFVTNLEARVIRGHESNGMILALSTEEGKFSLLEPNKDIPIGTKVK